MNEETNSLLEAKYRKSIFREPKLTAMIHLYLQKPYIILQCKNRGFLKTVTPFLAPDAQPLVHMFHIYCM